LDHYYVSRDLKEEPMEYVVRYTKGKRGKNLENTNKASRRSCFPFAAFTASGAAEIEEE
jgi:hypothetical protein